VPSAPHIPVHIPGLFRCDRAPVELPIRSFRACHQFGNEGSSGSGAVSKSGADSYRQCPTTGSLELFRRGTQTRDSWINPAAVRAKRLRRKGMRSRRKRPSQSSACQLERPVRSPATASLAARCHWRIDAAAISSGRSFVYSRNQWMRPSQSLRLPGA
jgi:hypothetical protein